MLIKACIYKHEPTTIGCVIKHLNINIVSVKLSQYRNWFKKLFNTTRDHHFLPAIYLHYVTWQRLSITFNVT